MKGAEVSSSKLEVWIDADFIDKTTRVGTLSHDRGNVRFHYDKSWLTHPNCYDIDPDLSLDDATFHPNPELVFQCAFTTKKRILYA